MLNSEPRGRLVVVSGPAGAGKTTVLQRVLKQCHVPLAPSVSATTRPPRPGESNGVDYHFLAPGEFQSRRERGDFIECFEVFGIGYWYGTLRSEVNAGLRAGKWVVLNINVDGALAVMEQYPNAVTIFVRPSSMEELERRLRHRNTETEEVIQQRLRQVQRELNLADRYRHQVINDDLDRAVEEICAILSQQWEADRDDRRASRRADCQ